MTERKPTKDTAAMIDMRLRGECLSMASGFSRAGNIPDTLRGAQLIYDWLKGGVLPGADTEQTTTA